MIVYNTTYTVPSGDVRHFLIWVREAMLPRVSQDGTMRNPRLLHILSHQQEGQECYSLQLETETSAMLHQWWVRQGSKLAQEIVGLTQGRVVGFSTMMENVTV